MGAHVIGIDPSLGGFALAVGRDGYVGHLEEHRTNPGKGVQGRIARIRRLTEAAIDLVAKHNPTHVFIEGYSMGSKGSAVTGLAELGGVLRWRLLRCPQQPVVVEVPPSRLKKWATGKGNAPKAAVMSALSRRYDRDFRSDNEADAFALCMLGMAALGRADVATEFQRAVALDVAKGLGEAA